MDITKFLVIDGGTVKTGEEGIVEGLGIVFGSEEQPDRSQERDFFTKDSKIRNKNSFEVPLYWEHGIKGFIDPIGEAVLTKVDGGWHASAEIDLTTDQGQDFYKKVKKEQYGFSTGSMSHLVRRESKGNNTHFLKNWPVGEISLVKMPAESRALVQSIKSLQELADAEEAPVIDTTKSNNDPVVALYDEAGAEIWNIESGEPIPPEAKSIEIKYASGAVRYSLYAMDDTDSVDVSINEYTDAASIISAMQEVLNKASGIVAVDTAVATAIDTITGDDTAEDMADGGDDEDMESDDFNNRVTVIVKSLMKGTDNKIAELEKQLSDKENDLADLKSQLESREEDLTKAQKMNAQLEILAGAQETINKYKGK